MSRPMSRGAAGRLSIGIAAGALAASALVPAAAAADPPVGWQATAGVSSRTEAVQANSFLPNDISVNVGDSITWTLRSGEFHTVTFLSGAEPPPLITFGPGGPEFNPAVVVPSGGPDYNGTGIANSGLLVKGNQWTLGFTQAGSYPFLCLVHAGMAGTVHVRDAGTKYPRTQAQYDVRSQVTANALVASGRRLQARTLAAARASGPGTVALGAGTPADANGSLAIMRFLPARIVIHAGDSVNWSNQDPEAPHTVTFGVEPPGGPIGAFAPSGVDGPGHATISGPGSSVNSGVIGAGLPFGTTFSATFVEPGTYDYICALHDDLGMTGTIVVLP
jgi:plastocyanin